MNISTGYNQDVVRTRSDQAAAKRSVLRDPIESAYLAWVGTENYPTVASWVAEATSFGVSKRIPTAAMGRALLRPKTVVFVAHDEGEVENCADCKGLIECPACRRLTAREARWRGEITRIKGTFRGDWATESTRGQKRSVAVREAHVAKLEVQRRGCKLCRGRGKFEASTGGSVELVDGRTIDYRTYTYWLHQPEKFDPDISVAAKHMCVTCGGTGTRPEGMVFGFFITDRVEYVMRDDETKEEAQKRFPSFKVVHPKTLKNEPKRRAGYREPGLYAVADLDDENPVVQTVLAELTARKLLHKASCFGSFVWLKTPLSITSKRFRGLAKFNISELHGK